ncbi:hypothetical protein BDQ17DRAFT_1342787 [Cyathus striatus]|nr:hypothetical protein BDQ17DRAFT_1342787 [Cyathus striatus]
MPLRPALKLRRERPSSAIYIGPDPNYSSGASSSSLSSSYLSNGTPPSLPDLPEPPSPSHSIHSAGSGLPSPPATNSTGSGSTTGDPGRVERRDLGKGRGDSSSGSSAVFSHPNASAASLSRDRERDGKGTLEHGPSTSTSAAGSSMAGSRSSSRLASYDQPEADYDYDRSEKRRSADTLSSSGYQLDDNLSDGGGDAGEDDTARMNLHRRHVSLANVAGEGTRRENDALEKVRSLTQRNRMALDKLSRLSPSPSRTSHTTTSSSTSSSRLRRTHQARASYPLPPQDVSGSETEREESIYSYSQSHKSSASTSQLPSELGERDRRGVDTESWRRNAEPPSPISREPSGSSTYSNTGRYSRASTSPQRQKPTNTRRNRGSWGFPLDVEREKERDGWDESTFTREEGKLGGARRRAALPREFVAASGGGESSATSTTTSGRYSVDPMTPHRQLSTSSRVPSTVPGTGLSRASTVRTPASARWVNEGFESPSNGSRNPRHSVDLISETGTSSRIERRVSFDRERESVKGMTPLDDGRGRDRSSMTYRERRLSVDREPAYDSREKRQMLRGGSAESALGLWSPGGRSLIGEGLRAAGLSRRVGVGTVGLGLGDGGLKGPAPKAERGERERRVEWKSPERGRGESDRVRERDAERERVPPRAATSMADYRYLGKEKERERIGEQRSVHAQERDRDRDLTLSRREFSLTQRDREERAESALARYSTLAPATPLHLRDERDDKDRRYSSPIGARRQGAQTPAHQPPQPSTGHAKLMYDAMNMFEVQVNRLPAVSNSSQGGKEVTATAELGRNAENVVYAVERLNSMLRTGTARALEAQIDAEVSRDDGNGSIDMVSMWSRVGGDYREGVRTSDELIRGMTGLLIGMSRVMREYANAHGAPSANGSAVGSSGDIGSPAMHSRSVSLSAVDEDRKQPSASGSDIASGSAGGSGRRSVESRRSWEPATLALSATGKERDREEALRRLAGDRATSGSVLSIRQRELDTPSPLNRVAGSSMRRRLLTPREKREAQADAETSGGSMRKSAAENSLISSPESVRMQDFDSPTPAGRASTLDRSRTLPPLSIPRPLPTLPSESLLRRNATTTEKTGSIRDRDRGERRKQSTTSIATRFRTFGRSQVTFSKPSTISVSALNGLRQQAERERTVSASSGLGDEIYRSADPRTPLSGSETERDIRRRTLGTRAGARQSVDNLALEESLEEFGVMSKNSTVNAADRSALHTVLNSSGRRERRRTVTEIWPTV